MGSEEARIKQEEARQAAREAKAKKTEKTDKAAAKQARKVESRQLPANRSNKLKGPRDE